MEADDGGGGGGGGGVSAGDPAPAAAPAASPEGDAPPAAAADDGGGEPGGGGREEVEEEWRGWWGSQLPKETRDKHRDRLLALKGKRMAEVFDDYFSNGDRLKAAVFFPGKNAKPEEIDAFLSRMNIPKTAAGYKLEARKLPDEWTPEARTNTATVIAEVCRRNGLTQRQGNAVYDMYIGHVKDLGKRVETARENLKATFDRRLEEECGDEKKASETREYFKRALVALADKRVVKELTDSGLFYSPVVVRAIADMWKAGNGEPPVMSAGGGKEEKRGDGGLPKSAEFAERYGRRRS
jgi:hypothetical protein